MANQNIDIVVRAIDEATATLKRVGGSISNLPKTASAAGEKITSSMEKVKGTFEAQQETIAKVGAVSGIAFGVLTSSINGAIQDASNLNNSLVGLKSIVQGTGNDFEKAKKIVQNFTADGLVTAEQAATSLKNLVSKGFSLDQAEQLMLRFKDSAAFGRQAALGLGEAIAGATEGIKNENSMLVDNAGVTKNVSVMVGEYAKAHGLKETALTAAQKNEAVYQGILKETTFQVGDAAKLSNEYSGQVAKLNAQKLQLSQTIGATLMPVMASLYGTITPILTTVMKWTQENPNLTKTIIIGTTAVAWLTAALSVLGLMIPSIITGFGAVVTAAKALGTALLFLTTNPIGLILTALAALAAAALYVYNNWETIRPKLQEVWTTIGGTVAYAVNAAKDAVNIAFDAISAKVTAVTDWLGKKVETVMWYATKIKNALENAGASLYEATHDEQGNLSIAGARASGGPVAGGKTYLVGENGPELFTPSRSGAIIPNNQLQGGGQTSVNINFGGVTVRNDQDIQKLADAVSNELTRKMQLWKQGIA